MQEVVKKIRDRAREYEPDMVQFLRDIVAIPSESCQEQEVVQRIKEEMEKVGFDEVQIDPMGNILGRVGSGSRIIAYDAHIDCVGVGNPDEWHWDPFRGKMEDGVIYGRGACDQKSGMAAMVYAGKVIKDLDLHEDFTLYFVGTVQEEDCDGLCWQYIVREGGLKPEFVVITEPTNLNIYRGQRGRMEMKIITEGISCHGSAPERGVNSIYRMAPIIQGIKELNTRLHEDEFLGRGTVALTHITNETPSLNAIPNQTVSYLDRRLTDGEDKELAIRQVREVIKNTEGEARIEMLHYNTPSYTGLIYPTEKYYPTWVVPPGHPVIESGATAFKDLFERDPRIDKWNFSTNGVAIMGLLDIPCLGFGPGNEIYAHTVNDQVPVEDLWQAAAFYAHLPHSV